MMKLSTSKLLPGVALGTVLMLTLGACASNAPAGGAGTGGGTVDGATGGGAVTDATPVEYWLWDDVQLPGYQACAALFEERTGIPVNISQFGWGQYWDNLTLQITAGSAPDAFTMTPPRLYQFSATGQLADLNAIPAATEGIDWSLFMPGLAENWVRDQHRWGIPLDWDMVGLVYNAGYAEEAGWTFDEVNNLTFEVPDGGTFFEFLKDMTVDTNGNNANSPDFDRNSVARYGFLPVWTDGARGQNGWFNLASAIGFTFFDAEGNLNYNSPEMIATMEFFQKMIDAGVAPAFDAGSTLGEMASMEAGIAGSTFAGSWNVPTYTADTFPQDIAFARVPTGPAGRFAYTNGLAAVIWSGSNNIENAARWVAFLGTPDCQDLTAERSGIFPAIESSSELAMQVRASRGADSSIFQDMAAAGESMMGPLFNRPAEVDQTIQDAGTAIATGADVRSTLEAANNAAQNLERN